MAVVFEGGGRPKPRRGPQLVLDLPPRERPAGWHREIAAPVLKEVEVCPTFLSDDSHTIGLPPRITQPSVGRYVKEVKHYRDASIGSHFALYGGVNLLPVFGERMKTVPTVPRTHYHFGTGVNTGFEEVRLHPSVLDLKVTSERANWVPAPSAASAKLVRLARATKRQQSEHQAVFPVPRDPAASLRRRRASSATPPPPPHPPTSAAATSPKMCPAEQHEEETVLPISSLLWPTPFWYNGPLRRAGATLGTTLGDPNDYAFCKLSSDLDPGKSGDALEINVPGYYVPGQIALADEGKEPGEPEPTISEDNVPIHRTNRPPLYKRRIIPIRPPQEHYLLDPWIGQEKEQLQRVGLPYRSAVCRAHYALYPPGPQPSIIQRLNAYPDLTLSSL